LYIMKIQADFNILISIPYGVIDSFRGVWIVKLPL
jgi:hypothetical protein